MTRYAERKAVASRRYDYSAVDEYRRAEGSDEWVCWRTIRAGLTKKDAATVADAFNDGYAAGKADSE